MADQGQSQAWADGYAVGWEAGQKRMAWQLEDRSERGPIPQMPVNPYSIADALAERAAGRQS